MEKKDTLNLKLRVAQVEKIPRLGASEIKKLDEYLDARDIILAVKKQGAAPAETWRIFDLQTLLKRQPEMRKMKALVQGFALVVKALMKEQGVDRYLSLQRRNFETYYLTGKKA